MMSNFEPGKALINAYFQFKFALNRDDKKLMFNNEILSQTFKMPSDETSIFGGSKFFR